MPKALVPHGNTLPAGTLSDGTNPDDGEAGCYVDVLNAASELTCAPGYVGSPSKDNAACDTDGGTFMAGTGLAYG